MRNNSELYITTNPPYMGLKGMTDKLKNYLAIKFDDSKSDMFAVFMEKIYTSLKENGIHAMINQQSWMFLSSYENLRNKIIDNSNILNMIHLGPRTFEEIGGEVVQSTTFTIRKNNEDNYISKIIRCVEFKDAKLKEIKFLELANGDTNTNVFNINIFKFKQIPKSPFSYWVKDSTYKLFVNNKMIGELGRPCKGIDTGDNNKFLRLWYELIEKKICFGFKDYDKAVTSKNDYYPYNKGGGYRKWYGNNEYVLFWGNNGEILKNFKKSNLRNKDYYRKSGLTWSTVTTNNFSIRYFDNGYYFDNGGCCLFIDNKNYYLGLLNSEVHKYIQQLSPTLNFQPGDIGRVPVVLSEENNVINKIVCENVFIAKKDWDSFETSWDFKVHPLLKLLDKGEKHNLSAIFRIWETECEEAFEQLKYNEEELNRIFIDIYGLQDELTPEIEDKDITIRKADRERDIKSFISYAVGCMLGRYSVDAEGLIYAGGEFKDKWNLEDKKVRKIEKDEEGNITSDSWVDVMFLSDSDNIIPITGDEYFEDDIVSRFIDFVRTVYSNETLEENLDFIADSIGRKPSETARQAIRRYFIKDFYKDYLKVYQKRPIYWLFESGKNDGFKALIYMHRYNEQTVAKVRTDYLHTLQRKYEAEIQRQQLIVDSEEYTPKDRTTAKKKIDRIAKQIEECREYDQVVAHLANEKISIDLDDGVKVNYDKFQGIKVINSKGKEVKMDLLSKI